jgi:hypothetical protein
MNCPTGWATPPEMLIRNDIVQVEKIEQQKQEVWSGFCYYYSDAAGSASDLRLFPQ